MTKHGSFEDWQKTVQEQNCAPDRDTIDRIMKAWESDRTHLKNELADKDKTFDDILNYGWGLLYPGKTDWEYPGQVINHLWAEVEIQRKKVVEAVAVEIHKYYPTIKLLEECGLGNTGHGNTFEGMIKELIEKWILASQGKLPEPTVTGIDLALHSDVTVLSVVHPNSNGSSVVDKIEGI
ncbi:MAG: hypothetical protein WC479_04615 [Candidatus Izemoplasmatales bacterium]